MQIHNDDPSLNTCYKGTPSLIPGSDILSKGNASFLLISHGSSLLPGCLKEKKHVNELYATIEPFMATSNGALRYVAINIFCSECERNIFFLFICYIY